MAPTKFCLCETPSSGGAIDSKTHLNPEISSQQKIEENAEYIADELDKGNNTDFLTYPPNGGLTEKESLSLEKLKNDPNLKKDSEKF